MKIIVDAFGGDNAPLEVIKGSAMAVKELDVDIILVGKEETIKKVAKENEISLDKISIKNAEKVIDVCEEPTSILKENADCSMAVGMKMLADDEGDAFVSAGSTGALVVGATFIVKRLKGIKRAALATIMPTAKDPTMLLDVGANTDCRPEMLTQFGIMGSCYMNKIMNINNPSVGLLNIGSEKTKGRELEIDTYTQLEKANINFVGNIEARAIPKGECNVIVTDGYTGNVALKLYEGMGSFFGRTLKDILMSGVKSKIAGILVLNKVKAFKKKMDYSEHGGAPLLGTSKPIFKAHGSSDAKAFYNAIRQADNFVKGKVIDEISAALIEMKSKK